MNPIMLSMMAKVKQDEMTRIAGKQPLIKNIQASNRSGSRNIMAFCLILSGVISLFVLSSIVAF